jgi:hypothetical protein
VRLVGLLVDGLRHGAAAELNDTSA